MFVALAAHAVGDDDRLLADTDLLHMNVPDADFGNRLGGQCLRGKSRELIGAQSEQDFRQQCGELRLKTDGARYPSVSTTHALGKESRNLLEGSVLQQPGEE